MTREMKDSGIEWIGTIPAGWKLLRGKNIFRQRSEKGNEDSLQLLSPSQKYGVIPQSKYEELSGMKAVKLDEKTDLTKLKTIHRGDYCISLRSFQGGFEFSDYEGVVSPAYQVFYPYINICHGYYKYLFKDKTFIDKMNSYTLSLRDGKNIAFSDFGNTIIPYPPEEEQFRIADFLDDKCAKIDSAIEKTQKTIEEYKALKQSIITETVIKGIRPNRDMKESTIEGIDSIPDSWMEIRNAFLFRENVRTPYDNSPSLSLSQADGLILTDAMKERSLKTSSFDGWKRVEIDDLVLNRFKAHLGVFFAATVEGMVSFHYGVFEPVIEISSKYYEYLFHSDVYRGIFAHKSNGMTVGLQNLSNQNFYSVKSLYPPMEEQKEIVRYIDEKISKTENLIQKKEELISTLDEYKKSLIYEYVTGKKEVPAWQ